MQIEDLPYPVYCEGSPDYLGVLFSVDLDQVEADDPLHFTVRGKFDLQNPDIANMIAAGTAGFGLLIECDQTDYYELRPCTLRFQENLIKAYFSDIVTITPVIYAIEEIQHYRNADLIDELKDQDITIPEGGIIAADGDIELTITRSQPQTVEAICKFVVAPDSGYNIDGESIIIYIPEEVSNRHKKMTKNQKIEVTSIYFPPVLQDIIAEYFCNGNTDYSDRKWYNAIRDAITVRNIDTVKTGPYQIMMWIIGDLLAEGVGYIPVAEEVSS